MTFHRPHSAQSVKLKDEGHAISGDDRSRAASAARGPAHLGAADRAASSRRGRGERATDRSGATAPTLWSGETMNDLLFEAQVVRTQSARLPSDFPERLLCLKRRAGLTWDEMAWALGVDTRQVMRWRRGAAPNGGAMLALVRLAAQIPDGIFDLFGDDFVIVLSEPAQLALDVEHRRPAHVALPTDSSQLAS